MGNDVPFWAGIEGRISGPRIIVASLLLVGEGGLIEQIAMCSCYLQKSLPTAPLKVGLVSKEGILTSYAIIHLAGTVSIETQRWTQSIRNAAVSAANGVLAADQVTSRNETNSGKYRSHIITKAVGGLNAVSGLSPSSDAATRNVAMVGKSI